MEKILLLIIVGFFILGSFGAVALESGKTELNSEKIDIGYKGGGSRGYTHTVFVEIGTGQFCGPCSSWNTNIYNTYNSGQYDFEYVEMIAWGFGGWGDTLNLKAYAWKNLYGINSIPTSIFDGNYQKIVGNYPSQLPGALNTCGDRSVKDLESSMIVSWLDDAKIQVDIEINNNEATQYNGYIRVPITEITSRYSTSGGQKYHFGFLDYAFQKDISINAGGVYTDSVIWDGNEHQDNHGNDFGDISKNNIKVIMGIFNDDNNYVDECIAAVPVENQNPSDPTITGPTGGVAGTPYYFHFNSVDPDGDDVYYYIKWGDSQVEDWNGPYASGVDADIKHTYESQGTFIIEAKAKDSNDAESGWSTFQVTMPRNKVINSPSGNFLQSHPNLFPLFQRLLLRLGLQ